MRTGSLFSGYGGLDMAVNDWAGATTAWVSDIDPGACKILAHRHPDVPNLGDITTVDWSTVEPVDILTGGFPCQDLSHAGKRAGLRPGTRSGLWAHMAYAIDQLRPRYVVAENVRGLLSAAADSDVEPCPWCVGGSGDGEPDLRALGAVLGDLAGLGYDAQWIGLRAADVGAPHGRFRVFILATACDANGGRSGRGSAAGQQGQARPPFGPTERSIAEDAHRATSGERWFAAPGQEEAGRARPDAGGRGGAPTPDADEPGSQGTESAWRRNLSDRGATPDPSGAAWRGAKSNDLEAATGSTSESGECPSQTGRRPERVMGYSDTHGNPAETRPGEVLPRVRREAGTETVRQKAGGSRGVLTSGVLLSSVREHEGRGDEGRAALAGTETQASRLQPVWNDSGPARSPHRPKPGEQRPSEPADPLRVLSSDAALAGGPGQAYGRCGEGQGHGCSAWGRYAPAIHRWEIQLGRLAPAPTELSPKGSARLSPRAVEFMMGVPDGWVCEVPDLTRNEKLKALGNGVVPQQAYAALSSMSQWEQVAA